MSRKSNYFLIIFFCLNFLAIFFCGIAQKSNHKKNIFQSNIFTINGLEDSINEISITNPDSALSLLKNAEKFVLNKKNNNVLMSIYFKQASILYRMGENDKALDLFFKTMTIAEQLHNLFFINASKIYIGTIYMLKSNFNLASKYNLEGLEYFENLKDKKSLAGIYLNLTFLQLEQGDTLKAIEYTNLSYKYAVESGSKIYESKSLLNFGEIYFLKKNYLKALSFYKESLEISEKNNFYLFIPTIKLNIGGVYSEMKMIDSAEVYYNYVINNEKSSYIKALGFIALCELYKEKRRYNKAFEFARKASDLAETEDLKKINAEVNNFLAELNVIQGNFRKAYDYILKSEQLKDSIFSEEKYRIQNELETVYETSKKEERITELSKEKEINAVKTERFLYSILFLSVILVASIILSLMILRQNKFKAKHETVELKQKLLRTQMNPHFIFNSLSSIQDFILSNNPIEASSYLSDFAKLMRAILVYSSESFIQLSKDVEIIRNYLKLQHLRLQDKFEYNISVSDMIDPDEYIVPPMLLQPFIENAIIHGIMKKTDDDKGFISVSYNLSDEKILLEVQDNGIGRKLSEQNSGMGHQSKSTEITTQRINLLSVKYKQNINFEIIDLTDKNNKPSGTLVRFKLPIL